MDTFQAFGKNFRCETPQICTSSYGTPICENNKSNTFFYSKQCIVHSIRYPYSTVCERAAWAGSGEGKLEHPVAISRGQLAALSVPGDLAN